MPESVPFPFRDEAETSVFVFLIAQGLDEGNVVGLYQFFRDFISDVPHPHFFSDDIYEEARQLLAFLGKKVPSKQNHGSCEIDGRMCNLDTRIGTSVDTNHGADKAHTTLFRDIVESTKFSDMCVAVRYSLLLNRMVPAWNSNGELVDSHFGRRDRPVLEQIFMEPRLDGTSTVRFSFPRGNGGITPYDVHFSLTKCCYALERSSADWAMECSTDRLIVTIEEDFIEEIRLAFVPQCATIGPLAPFVVRGYKSPSREVRMLSHLRLLSWLKTISGCNWTTPTRDPHILLELLDCLENPGTVWKLLRDTDGRLVEAIYAATAAEGVLSENGWSIIQNYLANRPQQALRLEGVSQTQIPLVFQFCNEPLVPTSIAREVFLSLRKESDTSEQSPRPLSPIPWSTNPFSANITPHVARRAFGGGLFWTALLAEYLAQFEHPCERSVCAPPNPPIGASFLEGDKTPNVMITPDLAYAECFPLWRPTINDGILQGDREPVLLSPHPDFWECVLFSPITNLEAPRRKMYDHEFDINYSPPVQAKEVDSRFVEDASLRLRLEQQRNSPVLFRTVSSDHINEFMTPMLAASIRADLLGRRLPNSKPGKGDVLRKST
jgi:hypothetical protein